MQSITLADMLARDGPLPAAFLVELFDYLREQSDFLHAVLGPGAIVPAAAARGGLVRTWCRN